VAGFRLSRRILRSCEGINALSLSAASVKVVERRNVSPITAEISESTGRATIVARSERQAMDWSLVLASQDIATTILAFPESRTWGLEVSDADRARALDAIRRFRLENRAWEITRALPQGTELRFHLGAVSGVRYWP